MSILPILCITGKTRMLEEMCNLCQSADRKPARKERRKNQLDRNFVLLFTKVKCCERASILLTSPVDYDESYS